MDQHKYQEAVVHRLNAIIGLLLDLVNKGEERGEGKQMLRLKRFGLENPEIGEIFGKSAEQVKKQIYAAKKGSQSQH